MTGGRAFKSGRELLEEQAWDSALRCVQCGYCLPVCPTYCSMGKESASPRGRINLVKLAAEGKVDVLQDLSEPIDLCLGCRACETACPVQVPYGHILEAAKEAIVAERAEGVTWEERLRAREREVHTLDERFRELEQRLRSLKARLALGTGVMQALPDPDEQPAAPVAATAKS